MPIYNSLREIAFKLGADDGVNICHDAHARRGDDDKLPNGRTVIFGKGVQDSQEALQEIIDTLAPGEFGDWEKGSIRTAYVAGCRVGAKIEARKTWR